MRWVRTHPLTTIALGLAAGALVAVGMGEADAGAWLISCLVVPAIAFAVETDDGG